MLNTQITNVKYVNEQVSKMLIGGETVWPIKPQFSFYTYQQGGSLDFKVWSDTGIVAVVLDGAEGTVNPPTDSNISGVRASGSSPAFNRSYIFSGNKKRTNISIPLFKKMSAVLSYSPTRVSRYGVDYKYGSISINIINDLTDTANFTVTIGSSSRTRSIPANNSANFGASRLAAGTYNIIIRDNEAGTTETRSVQIVTVQYTWAAAGNTVTETFDYGTASSPATTGTRLRKVDVYILSEAEAINLAPNYITQSQRAQWGFLMRVVAWVPFANVGGRYVPLMEYGPCIIEEGTGYTPNSEFIIGNRIKLISDSKGRIRTATSRLLLRTDQQFNIYVPSIWNPNGLEIDVGPTGEKVATFHPEVKAWTVTAVYPMFQRLGDWINNYTETQRFYGNQSYGTILNVVHRTNSTGSAPAPNSPTILAQAPITGDIESINHRDSVGKISAIEFNDLNLEKIEMYGNQELMVIQTDKTGTIDNINYPYGNLPSIIKAGGNKKLTAVHGNTVTYTDFNQAKFGFWIKHTDTNPSTRTFEITKVYRESDFDNELWGAGFAAGQYEVNMPNKLDLISYGVFTSSGGIEADLFDQPIVVNRPARVNVVYGNSNRPDVYLLDGGSYTLQSASASYDDLIGNWGTTLGSIINPTDGQKITMPGWNSRPIQYVSVP